VISLAEARDQRLVTERHERLLGDADYYAALAGIEPEWLWQPLSPHVGVREYEWVRRAKASPTAGLVLAGDPADGAPPPERLAAMAGALVRAFVDARVRTLKTALDDPGARDCTVLLVPDFFPAARKLPGWVKQEAASLLMARAGKKTVVYVADLDAALAEFGEGAASVLSRYDAVDL